MTVHRFYLEEKFEKGKEQQIFNEEFLHQVRKVLRMRVGDKINVFNSLGEEFQAEILSYASKFIVLKLGEKIERKTESERKVTLCQSLLKKNDLFEDVLRHGTEMGVTTFIPMKTVRVHQPFLKKTDRLKKIIQEAAEQSERQYIPYLEDLGDFKELIKNEEDVKIVLAEREGSESCLNKFTELLKFKPLNNLKIFIGPEGGFTEEELKYAGEMGVILLNLGPRILRSETAAFYILAAVDFFDRSCNQG